jgi:cysteine desulfurase
MKSIIYMDNNASTQVEPEVFEVMKPFLTDQYFNPGAMYDAARVPAQAIADARRIVAECLGGVDENEIIFTGSATESNNMAVFGSMSANPARRHIITTAVEHPSVVSVCKEAERIGCEVDYIGVDSQGKINMTEFIKALRPDTLLVSIMHANNETGVIFPIDELARLTKETDKGILFHTDATQSLGKLDIDLTGNLSNVDMFSFSGHKLHAPKGVGALYLRKGTACRPYIYGGHQERNRRAGTANVCHIAALGKACEIIMDERKAAVSGGISEYKRIEAMRDRLERSLLEAIPHIQINGGEQPRLPNTSNIACEYIEGEGILYQLNDHGICASSGSACTSGSLDPSHVLSAMKIPFTSMHGSVRFSLGRHTSDAEVDKVIEVFPGIVKSLRKLSPYWDVEKDAPREGELIGHPK